MRFLAIDFGEKRIGIALSDENKIIAYPLCIIKRSSDKDAIDKIRELCQQNEVERIILGYPVTVKGKMSAITKRVKNFSRKLKKLGLEVVLYDERWTTKIATNFSKDNMIDARAAAVMLGEYLERER